jgi:hypothetical protein
MKFERRNDVAVVVGFSSNTRKKTPWNNPNVDVFGINEGYSFKWWKQKPENTAGWFQIHTRDTVLREKNLNDPKHDEWMKQEHPFPIFTQEEEADFPSSVRFPIEDIIKEFGYYWKSTLAYAVAFCYLAGYKKVELYGFEMASDSEYWGQRANGAYIIGKAIGKGLDVYVPPTSKLLTGIRYAYENNLIGIRQDLETNITSIRNSMNTITSEAQSFQGRYFLLQELVKEFPDKKEFKERLDSISEEIKKRDNLLSLTNGRLQGIQTAIRLFDTYDVLESRSVG